MEPTEAAMKVENLMTGRPTSCSPQDHLASAAMKMWSDDCGILPVIDGGKIAGVITDRDIAMALAMKGAAATQVRVAEVITGRLVACAPSDEVADALELMTQHRIRRLPVVEDGRLVGLLSLNDVVFEAASKPGPQKKPTYSQIVKAMQAICEHRQLPVAA
jgi:CBS domain-containing protein